MARALGLEPNSPSTRPRAQRLYRRYSQEQLELLLQFVRDGRRFNEEHAMRSSAPTEIAPPAKDPS